MSFIGAAVAYPVGLVQSIMGTSKTGERERVKIPRCYECEALFGTEKNAHGLTYPPQM